MRETYNHGGKKIIYISEWIQGKLWIHVNGKTFCVEPLAKKSRSAHTGVTHNKVTAPMPGKVTKVLVNVGQAVTKGQPVVVMEAMKMEYTLKADLAGPVEKVLAKAGAQVSLGDILVQISEENS